MKHIDESRLESDLEYRFGYLIEFVGFGEADIAAIHGAAPHLAPRVEALVNAVYEKLFLYDATKRHFVPKQHGYEGAAPADLASLTLDHEQIKFRKQHLSTYLVRLVTHPYDPKMVAYLDMVGKIHTAKAGNPEVVVPLVQMNALMGFVSDALLQTILSLGLDRETEVGTLRAFNKLLWLQNDLLARHYLSAA
ncbi:protoglobin family protein [Sorangium sp. So ce726]|uniref:protoglobin family protein n=1 Tax=Sorangium sp. So ce726 TaxID=3133319 RepID=UPI003F6067BD